MPLGSSADNPYEDVERLGFIIKEIRPGQNHCGFLYRLDDLPPQTVHLAWDNSLVLEAPDGTYLWTDIEPLLDVEKHVASIQVDRIARVSQGGPIPYGLRYAGLRFDKETGRLEPAPKGLGMTCATFIVVVLESLGHRPIETSGWPEGIDLDWQNWVVRTLTANGSDPDHVAAVTADIGVMRVKPEHIVGSGCTADWPIDYPSAVELAEQIIADVARLQTN